MPRASARLARTSGAAECCLIGGHSLYAEALNIADCIYATIVLAQRPADTWFPPLNPAEWIEIASEQPQPAPADEFPYLFVTLERRHA